MPETELENVDPQKVGSQPSPGSKPAQLGKQVHGVSWVDKAQGKSLFTVSGSAQEWCRPLVSICAWHLCLTIAGGHRCVNLNRARRGTQMTKT